MPWAQYAPQERADLVRSHRSAISVDQIADLFCLTLVGAFAILGGDVWRPEHSTERKSMAGMKDTFFGDRPYANAYPSRPGYKESTTSKDAADAVEPGASILREQVYLAIRAAGDDGLTPDEVAARLNESVLAVRPRVTELAKATPPRIVPTEERRKNTSGLKAKVWRAVG